MRRLFLMPVVLAGCLAACSPQQAAAPDATPQAEPAPPATAPVAPATAVAPPMADRVYVTKGACPGEGCYLAGRIKAYEVSDLYDKPGKGAASIGQIAAGEWVEIVSTEEHLVPSRGVVTEARGAYAVGDVIYLLSSEGEGCASAWSKGAVTSWCAPDTGLEPENSPPLEMAPRASDPEGLGLWVKVKREKGEEGWIRDPGGAFACTGYQDRDADCPPLPQ